MISRPLDPGEAFFTMSDLVSCMNFVVFAERSGTLEATRIQAVLNAVQPENPLLQTRIHWSDTDGLRFEPAPDALIDLQCHSVAAGNWQQVIEQELSRPFGQEVAPLVRCLYLQWHSTPTGPADHSVLALTFHHAVADGRSGAELLRRVLSLIATDAFVAPITPATFLPAMVEVMPQRYRWAEQPEAAKQLRNTLITDYRRHGTLPTLPWLATEAAGREPQFIRLHLSAATTQNLMEQARAHGTTVHGVLCAAQLLAQFKLHTSSDDAPPPTAFFLSCPVDLRAHLEPVQPSTPTGFYVSLISATFQISADTEVWALARDIIEQTRLQLARGEGHLLYYLYGLDGSPVLPNQLASFCKKALASLPNTMVSNVGAIATVEADPAVSAISFALCPMPYQSLFTAASSYNGQLILNVGFDAQRLSPTNAQRLVDTLQANLQPSPHCA
jgi:NRPS condensation-like uncharacterized protein